jgi:hypothetical protein
MKGEECVNHLFFMIQGNFLIFGQPVEVGWRTVSLTWGLTSEEKPLYLEEGVRLGIVFF